MIPHETDEHGIYDDSPSPSLGYIMAASVIGSMAFLLFLAWLAGAME